MKRLIPIALALCAALATASAQTVTTITSFDGTDGYEPFAGLVQGLDGDLYGTTAAGGANNDGTIYKITPEGTLTSLYSFCSQTKCADGENPYSVLIPTLDGNFYGTTQQGGAHGAGVVFEYSRGGKLKVLYSFCAQSDCTDGKYPRPLVLGNDGNLYGGTFFGGTNCISQGGCGTLFEITAAGKFTTLYNFCAETKCADGQEPTGLMQAANGSFYGTTEFGGRKCFLTPESGCGTVFEFTPGGKLTTLYTFCSKQPDCADGAEPLSGLILASNGKFYGTTFEGGNYISPNGFSAGTAFEITAKGEFTTLYDFCPDNSCTAGSDPWAGVIQGSDGNFYGTTYEPGAVYQLTPQGQATYSPELADYTTAGIVQATNGTFYGAVSLGEYGSIFTYSVGLGPFVETLPGSGKVGEKVVILGSDLTGSTSVTFNGTSATFTVVSATEIATTVPAGATTGTVEVVTPSGTLDSSVRFRVPQ